MSPRTRATLILILTLGVVSAGFGYMFGRMHIWHERGWAGVFFYPEVPQSKKGPKYEYGGGFVPGEVVMLYAGSPADRVLRQGDRILTVNGIPLRETPRLRALDNSFPDRGTVTYRIERQGKQMNVTLRLESPLKAPYILTKSLVALLVAAAFVGVALVVFSRRPDDQRTTVLLAFALISATAMLGGAATVYETLGGRGIAPTIGFASYEPVIFGVVAAAYAPLILHLALIFPRRRPILERRPYVIRWTYAFTLLAALIFLGFTALLMVMFSDPGNEAQAAYYAGTVIGASSKAIALLGLVLALYIIYAGRREGIVRAFAHRPFRAVFALFAMSIATTNLIGQYGSKKVALIVGLATVFVPALILCSFPVLAGVALVRSYREAGVEEKRQVQWPLWGLMIALFAKIGGVGGGIIGSIFLGRHGQLVAWRTAVEALDVLPMVASLLVPISFAAAILKYRLMNIDVIIRKTVVYAILTGAILVFYVGVVGGVGSLVVSAAGVQNQTLIIAATLVLGMMFIPVRNKLQTLVDRNLFRHKYDYPDALRAITLASRGATDTAEFLATTAEKLQQALQSRAVVIFTERQDEFVATAKIGVSDTLLGRLRVPKSFVTQLDRPFDPRRRPIPEEAAASLARIETVLVVPAGPRAFIAAAAKLSGGELDVEDVDFLRSAADQVEHAMDRIRMQVEEADFAQARAIQQTLLPREMPRVAKLDLSGIWQPARTMGGDYYDLLKLGEHELAVCIGDVAGKGMPAALLMSGLQAAVRASASNSPRDLCERVRRVVVSSLSGGRFVTFFYATVDTAAMTLRWCNAGHNAPILARADGTLVRLSEGGPAISRLFRDAYEERELALQPGDRLVLFTDGVSEAMDGGGELFGEQRIEAMVAESRHLDAHALQRTIVEASTQFSGGEIEDDVTLVVVGVAS
ncbi:MAG TPA: SpoIIE family protein phosphatase [Thermoanaerobaculia bacterium]|jgi:serine phosphatase RsbU (regulator of sigma subunit)